MGRHRLPVTIQYDSARNVQKRETLNCTKFWAPTMIKYFYCRERIVTKEMRVASVNAAPMKRGFKELVNISAAQLRNYIPQLSISSKELEYMCVCVLIFASQLLTVLSQHNCRTCTSRTFHLVRMIFQHPPINGNVKADVSL